MPATTDKEVLPGGHPAWHLHQIPHTPSQKLCRLLLPLALALGGLVWIAQSSVNLAWLQQPLCSGSVRAAEVPTCPIQPPAQAPSMVWTPETNATWLAESADRLGAAVRFPTVSCDDMSLDPTEDERFKVLLSFHRYLEKTFPLVHSAAKLTKVNTYALLYELVGTDPTLKPALYAAHQDVVPVPKDTEARWSHLPFGGEFDPSTGLVWGRGASDDKSMLIGILEALEQLQREGFQNKRTILLASGFDEEVGGRRGAASLADELRSRYPSSEPIEFILDEGGLGIGTTQGGRLDVAMPAVGEKGYADVRISVTAAGGHSSNPILTHLICLADALDKQERHGTASEPEAASPGFKLDRSLRKQLRRPRDWSKAAQRIAREGTRAERYVIQTSQAVDVVVGGAKANALPESASAVVNHRIAVDSNVQAITDRMAQLVGAVAKRFDLELIAFPDPAKACPDRGRSGRAGQVRLDLVQASEPTPMSSAESEQFGRLASTIKHVFPGRKGRERLVTPVVMTGNTDTRWYLDLSSNIWRFHPNTFMMDSDKHAIDERMDIYAHAQTARFIHALVRNTDDQL